VTDFLNTLIKISTQQNEVIFSWGEWILNVEETPCSIELFIYFKLLLIFILSYSFHKIKNKDLSVRHSQVRVFILLSFPWMQSIKWTIMEILCPPLHQSACFTPKLLKDLGRTWFLWIFIESCLTNSVFIHLCVLRWFEEKPSFLREWTILQRDRIILQISTGKYEIRLRGFFAESVNLLLPLKLRDWKGNYLLAMSYFMGP
jgi:hypothetical protein